MKKSQVLPVRSWLWALGFLLVLANFAIFGPTLADQAIRHNRLLEALNQGEYLIIFQNNTELRSSGGFIGSYAVINFNNFRLENLAVNSNIYKLDHAFTSTNYVTAPSPLDQYLEGQSWSLRDANYDVSYPSAAEDIIDFYQKETGRQVDGVIAINATVIRDLLKITGPIQLAGYEEPINFDNFLQNIQSEVEKKYYENPENWIINEPKSILKTLFPVLLEKVRSENKTELSHFLRTQIEARQLMAYSRDEELEDLFKEYHLAGQVYEDEELNKIFGAPADYLNININNYSSNKSSLAVRQKAQLEVSGQNRKLTLVRSHHGSLVWPDGVNNSYIRVLVPAQSKLKKSTMDGADITANIIQTSEAGKLAFGFFSKVAPDQSSEIVIEYQVPLSDNPYQFLYQKQSGTIGDWLKIINNNQTLFDGEAKSDITVEL